MMYVPQGGATRLKKHFAVRVINQSRYILECWYGVQHGLWTLETAYGMQQAAEQLQRYAARYDQSEHLAIAQQISQTMQQIFAVQGRLTTETIGYMDVLMQRLTETRLQFTEEGVAEEQGAARMRDKPLYLAISAADKAVYLAEQLAFYGLATQVLHNADELRQAFKQRYPLALVMDIDFSAPEQGLALVAEMQSQVEAPVPIVFVRSGPVDVMMRLAAVRNGGEAFLQGELDASAVLELLESTVASGVRESSRVLIVDDSKAQAMMTERVLNSAAIMTRVVHNPTLALKELDEFNPALVILDMYMPECSGPELAKMIRQCNRFDSIPIIYQSAEEDLDKQLNAMRQGADDFLTKPVRPSTLIATVRNRVARARSLKARMVRDSLTGLYNHTHIQQLLEETHARARREDGHLSVVMLDIDHFKRVNDTHGHPMGDKVIKSLSMLLKQRLRKNDMIGRYGGEEFLLVLPGATASQAAKVVEELRVRFLKMHFQGETGRFSCTFSAGVAECITDDERPVMDWIAQADQALYKAKHQGRNQVVLSA